MILAKLEEALAAIPAQHKALDEVEIQLRSMIAKLHGMSDFASPGSSRPTSSTKGATPSRGPGGKRDKLDDIVDVLRTIGKPEHITIIAESLSTRIGKKIDRTDIEPGLNRHISKTKVPRIAKFGPSIYGLPEWKQPSLAKTA